VLVITAPVLGSEVLFAGVTNGECLVSVDPFGPSALVITPEDQDTVIIAEIELGHGLMLGSDTSNNERLHFIDPITGDLTGEVLMTFPPEGDVITAMEYIGGTLYAGLTTEGGGGDAYLSTIDTGTGTVTLVGGPTGVGGPLGGLAFNGSELYAVSAGGAEPALYTLDLVTGNATLVATVMAYGVPELRLTALEFTADGSLSSLANAFGTHGIAGHLLSVDPVNGMAVDLGDTGLPGLVALTSSFVFSLGRTDADLALPFGVLDLADIVAFVERFSANDPSVNFDGNGVWDLADIVAFVELFNTGCP
jgi:hypothetical protein